MGSIVKEKRNVIGFMTRQDGSNRFLYTCTRCGMEFQTAASLELHFESHTQRNPQNLTRRMDVRGNSGSGQSASSSQNHTSP